MKKPTAHAKGFSLPEVLVSFSVLVLFMGMVAWLAKGTTIHRISSERRLKQLQKLQKVMFFIENDLMSARRHTLGNVLCNNIVFTKNGKNWRTSSDPGFDSDYNTQMTTSFDVRNQWYYPVTALQPAGTPGYSAVTAWAHVDQTPAGRLHGTGSLAIRSNQTENSFYTVRSPDFSELLNQNYVIAGWVRGGRSGAASLVPQIAFQESTGNGLPANDIASVSADHLNINFGNWTYLTARINANKIFSNKTYNVYLRTEVRGANAPEVMTAFFDSITATPATAIARIDFLSAESIPAAVNPNFNLNNRRELGMVFFQSDPQFGTLREMKYIFANGDQHTYPVVTPDLLRFSSFIPYFHTPWGFIWTNPDPTIAPDPNTLDEPTQSLPPLASLSEVRSISVDWVGGWSGGANRPIKVDVTVMDTKDPNKVLTLSRTFTPPTD
jgi:Tfp pilus assembly protein PilV